MIQELYDYQLLENTYVTSVKQPDRYAGAYDQLHNAVQAD